MAAQRIILVTGANQGLGFEIVKVTAQRDPSSVFVLACRRAEAGEEAVGKLKEEGIKAKLDVVQLDVTNDEHIAATVAYVDQKYGRLDALINNAAMMGFPKDESLGAMRQAYNQLLNTNLTSVGVLTAAFLPLLHKADHPRVINVSSGLGSITIQKIRNIMRNPYYGASKVGLNGVTIHMQMAENDRVKAEVESGNGLAKAKGYVKYYSIMPGLLRTAMLQVLSKNAPPAHAGDPEQGAEVVTRLTLAPDGTYEHGTLWEFVDGEMRMAPW